MTGHSAHQYREPSGADPEFFLGKSPQRGLLKHPLYKRAAAPGIYMATILRYHIKAGRTGFLSAPLLSIRRIHHAPVGGTLLPNLVHIELGHDQAVIDALVPHQLVVGSHLGDAVLVDDDDPVCFCLLYTSPSPRD